MAKGREIVLREADGVTRFGAFVLRRNGLEIDGNPTFDEWQQCGQWIQKITAASLWLIGDWLNEGELRYGEKYSQAMEATGLEYQTLRNAKYVAAEIQLSRRRDNLTFSHHAEVAPLPIREADEFLRQAEEGGISAKAFRKHIREAKRDRQLKAAAKRAANLPADERFETIASDFRTAEVEDESLDCIITDPPYPEEFLPLYGDLGEFAARALKPGGSLFAMCGQSYLDRIIPLLGAHVRYHWALAYLTPGGQAVQLWNRKVNTFWKPVLWFVKGEYEGDWLGDVTQSSVNDNDKDHHHWGQSESGMADLIERATKPGDLICDPFMGGGTTGVVAVRLARKFLGIELDPTAADAARTRIHEETFGE